MACRRAVEAGTARLAAGILMCGLAGIVALPALAARPTLPALLQPAGAERHSGKVVLDQLVTPDLGAAERFYAGMFGWTFQPIDDGSFHYATASVGGHPVARLFERRVIAGQHQQSAWLTFFSSADVDAANAIALQHGAHLLFGPQTIPDLGREVVLRDPQGAVFALLASSSGDPADVGAADGEWIWRSLITTDPDNSAAFYQMLLGYDVYDVTADAETRHLILASGGFARAGVNALPASRPDAHPRWLNYIRVDDVAAGAAKATSLGGHVLVQPRLDHGGSRIAVVADPLGAPLGLMQWSDTDSQAGAK